MFTDYVARGLVAGLVAGVAFAAFVALVGNPLVAGTEAVAGGEAMHHEAPAVAGAVAGAVSVVAGVALGLLFGAGFGAAYFFLEPVLPGGAGARSYLLGAAGFVTVSGAPWLVLPPRPAGVEAALPTDVRLAWYAGMMGLGALVCGLAGYAYVRVDRARGTPLAVVAAALPFALLAVPVALAPANPVQGAVPDALVAAFRGVVLVGQVAVWAVLAGTHAWLCRRDVLVSAPPEVPPVSAD
ncbi:MAG: CbtA family protein [Haloferacaceae archaeon]